jgi:hypothetical protein
MKVNDKKDEQHKGHARAADKPGEVHADEQRPDRGPTYQGGDWDLSDEEQPREALDRPAEEEVESNVERADEELDDPGTRGAVFGKGGKGLVERDEQDLDKAEREKRGDPSFRRGS